MKLALIRMDDGGDPIVVRADQIEFFDIACSTPPGDWLACGLEASDADLTTGADQVPALSSPSRHGE